MCSMPPKQPATEVPRPCIELGNATTFHRSTTLPEPSKSPAASLHLLGSQGGFWKRLRGKGRVCVAAILRRRHCRLVIGWHRPHQASELASGPRTPSQAAAGSPRRRHGPSPSLAAGIEMGPSTHSGTRRALVLVAHLVRGYFAGDEELISWDRQPTDGCTDFRLVLLPYQAIHWKLVMGSSTRAKTPRGRVPRPWCNRDFHTL